VPPDGVQDVPLPLTLGRNHEVASALGPNRVRSQVRPFRPACPDRFGSTMRVARVGNARKCAPRGATGGTTVFASTFGSPFRAMSAHRRKGEPPTVDQLDELPGIGPVTTELSLSPTASQATVRSGIRASRMWLIAMWMRI
jgi:hypothetical protein